MIKATKTVFLTLLFIVGITFSMNNTEEVVLSYYFGFKTPPMPLFLLVLFAVLLGVLFAGLGFIIDQWSIKRGLKQKEREIVSLEKELEHYRDRSENR